MLHPRIDGVWLTDIGPFADVKCSENWRRGCDTAEFRMDVGFRDSRLYAGARVEVCEGVVPVWTGELGQQPPRTGTWTASGLAQSANGVKAIDGGGSPTRIVETAVVAAMNRGAVPWTHRGVVTGSGTAEPGDVDATTTLDTLLDQYSDRTGWQWRVDHHGVFVDSTWPTTPSWMVLLADDLWSISDTNYVTHLNVTFLDSAPSFQRFQRTAADSAVAALRWRHVEKDLDLTGLGVLTLAQAQQYADTVLARTGPKMQLNDPITVGPGQLRTLGDTEAGWTAVHCGQMLRLAGVPDRSRPTATLHTDVTIGRVERDRSTLTMTPAGAETQTFEDVIAELVKEV